MVFGQPPTTHPFIQAAYAAPAADAGFDGALREFDAARADEKRVDVAVAALRALPADPQRQPLQAAYLGSALAHAGQGGVDAVEQDEIHQQGLDQLDAALAMLKPEHGTVQVRGVPVTLQMRLVAAATFVAVPDGLFHRRADGRKLLAALRADPLLAAAPAAFRAEVEAAEARLAESAK